MLRRLPLLFSVLLLWSACGGPVERVVTPFTDEHEPLFENGLDLIRDPAGMEGSWLETWEQELDARITHADLVLLVRVQTIRQDTDLDRRDTFRLIVHVDRKYLGEVEDELTLVTREDDGGFQTVESNERRLLDEQFIAFVKWQRDEETLEVIPRWHLSPATDAVVERVRALLETRRQIIQQQPGRQRVIIHRG
ncbi:MAG: hypothetical protein KC619_35190 [Myxococcales bacterium]|nr:hypothetical protein [Myxococcales bacterium]